MKASELAQGKWPGLLEALFGVDPQCLTGKNGPCPLCGGRDRYRWIRSEGGGQWICNQCTPQGGDGAALAMAVASMSYNAVALEVERYHGQIEPCKPTTKKDPNILLDRIAQGCVQVTHGTATAKYLKGRGIVKGSPAIRHHQGLVYWDNGERLGTYPAMVTRIQDATRGRQSYQVIYLEGDRKADLPSSKKVMPHCGGIMGAGAYLGAVGAKMAVCEGVETGLAIQQGEGLPVIAALGTAGMERLILPDVVRDVVIFADNDENFSGQKAAFALANRLHREKRAVQVVVPDKTGDYLDFLTRHTEGKHENIPHHGSC